MGVGQRLAWENCLPNGGRELHSVIDRASGHSLFRPLPLGSSDSIPPALPLQFSFIDSLHWEPCSSPLEQKVQPRDCWSSHWRMRFASSPIRRLGQSIYSKFKMQEDAHTDSQPRARPMTELVSPSDICPKTRLPSPQAQFYPWLPWIISHGRSESVFMK